jgi:hypothetical protein
VEDAATRPSDDDRPSLAVDRLVEGQRHGNDIRGAAQRPELLVVRTRSIAVGCVDVVPTRPQWLALEREHNVVESGDDVATGRVRRVARRQQLSDRAQTPLDRLVHRILQGVDRP